MPERNERGHFLPGNSGGPGRPPKAKEEEYLTQIGSAFPPDVVVEKLQKALQLAEETNSARGILAAIEMILQYQVGKPVQMEGQSNTHVLALINLLQGMSEPDEPVSQNLMDDDVFGE